MPLEIYSDHLIRFLTASNEFSLQHKQTGWLMGEKYDLKNLNSKRMYASWSVFMVLTHMCNSCYIVTKISKCNENNKSLTKKKKFKHQSKVK